MEGLKNLLVANILNPFSEVIFAILAGLYDYTGNLGYALIIFTLILRLIFWPLTQKSLTTQKEIRKLQPELKKLKQKISDPQKLRVAQMELYQKYNVNPLSGCLPQIFQLVILLILYQALRNFFNPELANGAGMDPYFWGIDLRLPDRSFRLPVIVALSQLLFSIMILPGSEVADVVPNKSRDKQLQTANKKEEDVAEMAASMQKQLLFFLPLAIGYSATILPSGLVLYWTVATILSMVQQYFTSGWGGLSLYYSRLVAKLGLVSKK